MDLSSNNRLAELLRFLEPESVDADAAVLEEFARRLLARAPEDFLSARSLEQLRDDVVEVYRLVEETPPDEIGVRLRKAPGKVRRANVCVVMPDCAFIVDTVRERLHAADLAIAALLHPVLVLDRDRDGRILRVRERGAEGPRTSITCAFLDGALDDESARVLEEDLRHRVRLLLKVTGDFPAMMERCQAIVADLEEDRKRFPWRTTEIEEVQELLAWLRAGNFVFLGHRRYVLEDDARGRRVVQVESGTGLGILADEERSNVAEPTPLSELSDDLRARLVGGPLLIVSKTNSLSPVHRRARMDDISVKKIGADGEVSGERRFVGLFTAKAFAQDASDIPILRRKLREILEAEQADKGSHDHGLIIRIFNTLPKEELFSTPVTELIRLVETVMESHASEGILIFARPDALGRGVNAMVIMPRQKFSADVRKKIQEILTAAWQGRLLNYHLSMGEGDQARLHFHIDSGLEDVEAVDLETLEDQVRDAVRTWRERVTLALEGRHSVERAHELADRYVPSFPAEYQAATEVGTVVHDIDDLELLRDTGQRQVVLSELEPPRPDAWRLRVFARQGRLILSDVMPVLENFGFRVVESEAFEVGGPIEEVANTIHTFLVEVPPAWEVAREEAEPRVSDAFSAIQNGWAENLRINQLVLSAGLTWREVALLKAYGAYAFRIGAVSSRLGVRRPMLEHPATARLLLRIFTARMDPAVQGDRDAAVASLTADFQRSLENVRSIEDDRTYRRFLNLVEATVRTNWFQERARARPTSMIALKFDCERIEVMPRPRPKYEVWVSSASTEGAHLRMDDVARGGIRWSDRTEDFRVEVLGLVKTQQVKNAVIVPAGAKGAFVVTAPPADPAEHSRAGRESYRDFIRGLLDLTDNVVEGKVRHPPQTVVRDGEDPYLVVAADKGTARLSDTANELAAEYGFWLGDAFASGGSRGYDHKELGITARGAWECVRRHFRELGVDIQQEEFSVVGIGDMSGDVFGNGMLLSRTIQLVGAFDHRHIFVDPEPDPAAAWEERRRLFELPASSWDDYDRERISRGGGVWERGAKRIELSEPIRRLLAIEDPVVNGDTLIRALLRARVDLLWNGGIGTYVKASSETHGAVGDPGNDAVRIDAAELRARVVGEGGNLGLTQAARVEYALAGGRCNTDALDNSAGVDTSDHEVNLKILLNGAMDRGALDAARRDTVLAEVADDVAERVLANNYTQSLAVSLDEHRVRHHPEEFRDALTALERAGFLDRQLEGLPSAEAMTERREKGLPVLARPELAVLMAYAKLHLKRRLQEADLARDPSLSGVLYGYFPERVLDVTGTGEVDAHRLRDRIIGTRLTNRLVDWMGGTGHIQLVRETGHATADVARAWYVGYRVGDGAGVFDRLRALDGAITAGVQAQWLLRSAATLGRATRWLLAKADPEWTIDGLLELYLEPVRALLDAFPRLLPEHYRTSIDERLTLLQADGMDEETARRVAGFQYLDALLPVARLARRVGVDARLAGEAYFGISREIDFPWLQEKLTGIPGSDLWELRAAKALMLDLEAARTRIVGELLHSMGDGSRVDAALEEFRRRSAPELARIHRILDELHEMERPGLAALMVAVHAVAERPLAGGEAGGPAPP